MTPRTQKLNDMCAALVGNKKPTEKEQPIPILELNGSVEKENSVKKEGSFNDNFEEALNEEELFSPETTKRMTFNAGSTPAPFGNRRTFLSTSQIMREVEEEEAKELKEKLESNKEDASIDHEVTEDQKENEVTEDQIEMNKEKEQDEAKENDEHLQLELSIENPTDRSLIHLFIGGH